MKFSNSTTLAIFGIALLILIILGVGWHCNKKDKFTRTAFDNTTNSKFVRTPVDFAMKIIPENEVPDAWQRNPHYLARPSSKYQPLEEGPIDFYADDRRLAEGKLWEQYGPNWKGTGTGEIYITNDQKTRSLLREVGDEEIHSTLANMQTPLHGPGSRPSLTEQSYWIERPEDRMSSKIYGGYPFFINDWVGR